VEETGGGIISGGGSLSFFFYTSFCFLSKDNKMRNDWEQSPSSSVTTLDTSDSQVFDDKNLEVLKKNDWGGGRKKFPKNSTNTHGS
jgi:hypothetical protein